MRWFRNFRTSVKLITSFVLIAIIMAFVGFYGLSKLGSMNSSMDKMYNDRLVPIIQLNEARISYQKMKIDIRDVYRADTQQERDPIILDAKKIKSDIEEKMNNYGKTIVSVEKQSLFNKFAPAWEAYNDAFDRGVALANDGQRAQLKALIDGEITEKGTEVSQVLQDLEDMNRKQAEQASIDGNAMYTSTRSVTIIIVILSLLLCIGLGIFISQIIARPLHQLARLVKKVADGDLRETTVIDTKDEVGQVAEAMNDMILKLRNVVGSILHQSNNVAASAEQISASTEEIASGSTHQANAAQTVNELFRELSNVIQSVAQNTEMAAELSAKTIDLARDGGKVVHSSIEGMQAVTSQVSRMEEDSAQVGEIIQVIEDIADQTNLLALNAAIEAARAGEQGRGFAVVADEVRKLAERSGEATKQITSIIKGMQQNTHQSVKAVEDSNALSHKTGEAFEQIVRMINEASFKVQEIAAASEEQAAQSNEVLSSIESISATTQESAASSEQTAAAAQTLAQLAEEMQQAVAIFKV